MQPFGEAEESCPAVFLSQDRTRARIHVHAFLVREANDARAVAAFEELQLQQLRARKPRARARDDLVERQARGARGHLTKAALGERLQLRAENQREAGQRGENGEEAYREPRPSVNEENGVAESGIHPATLDSRPEGRLKRS